MRTSGKVNMWIFLIQRRVQTVTNIIRKKNIVKKKKYIVNPDESHTLHGQHVHSHERHSAYYSPLLTPLNTVIISATQSCKKKISQIGNCCTLPFPHHSLTLPKFR